MAPRREHIEAYERFAIKQAPSAPVPESCPPTRMVCLKDSLEPPPPPPAKLIKERSDSQLSHEMQYQAIESAEMLHDYRSAVEQLAETCETLIQERDFWKVTAASIDRKKAPRDESPQEDARVEALRKLLARELHPDKAKSSSEEAALRTELFKRLWPQIDLIVKGQSPK
jgi:hypothetical protein